VVGRGLDETASAKRAVETGRVLKKKDCRGSSEKTGMHQASNEKKFQAAVGERKPGGGA